MNTLSIIREEVIYARNKRIKKGNVLPKIIEKIQTYLCTPSSCIIKSALTKRICLKYTQQIHLDRLYRKDPNISNYKYRSELAPSELGTIYYGPFERVNVTLGEKIRLKFRSEELRENFNIRYFPEIWKSDKIIT
jgi:hypothetical protein